MTLPNDILELADTLGLVITDSCEGYLDNTRFSVTDKGVKVGSGADADGLRDELHRQNEHRKNRRAWPRRTSASQVGGYK